MRIKKTSTNPTNIKLTITADPEFLEKTKNHVLRHLAGEVKLPGFRSGKAPLGLVEKSTDSNVLQSRFMDEAINRMYSDAVRAESLRPVADPKVSIKKFVPFTELEFDAEPQ